MAGGGSRSGSLHLHIATRWVSHGHPRAGSRSWDLPQCQRPADQHPQDLHCDEQQFRNYPGVEDQDITDAELAARLAKGHLVAFDTHAELTAFVASYELILNKLGLIVKTRNGIAKARMI